MLPVARLRALNTDLEAVSFGGGLAAVVGGGVLAAGLMVYRSLVEDTSYTAEAWISVPTVWIALATLWVAVFRWSYAAMAPAIGLAIFAGIFFSDVFGHYVLAVLMLFALIKVVLETRES